MVRVVQYSIRFSTYTEATMAKTAFLILAHEYPELLGRLVRRFKHPEAVTFVHVDRKSDFGPFKAAVGGGLDPVTSNTIIELIVKQRDVYKTSALLVTHRLQDAFTMATHQFDKQSNQMVLLPPGQHCEVRMSFLILRDGKVIFDGDLQALAQTHDEYIREYIS